MIFACEVLHCSVLEFMNLESSEGIYWIRQAISYRERVNQEVEKQIKKGKKR